MHIYKVQISYLNLLQLSHRR